MVIREDILNLLHVRNHYFVVSSKKNLFEDFYSYILAAAIAAETTKKA